jgi:hypothetical protein
MKKTIMLDQATTPDGRPMTLHEHDGVFMIRIDGVELMSTRQHHSEEKLAELACAQIGKQSGNARVLIGGLGLGFTLRAALENLGPDAAVVVVELMPDVIRWNQNADYKLAADAMADPRVEFIAGDVVDVGRGTADDGGQRDDAVDAVAVACERARELVDVRDQVAHDRLELGANLGHVPFARGRFLTLLRFTPDKDQPILQLVFQALDHVCHEARVEQDDVIIHGH